jgi:hypothetical protein
MGHQRTTGITGPLFDTYVMVDWSSSSIPKVGPDSIWYCIADACNCKHIAQMSSVMGSQRDGESRRIKVETDGVTCSVLPHTIEQVQQEKLLSSDSTKRRTLRIARKSRVQEKDIQQLFSKTGNALKEPFQPLERGTEHIQAEKAGQSEVSAQESRLARTIFRESTQEEGVCIAEVHKCEPTVRCVENVPTRFKAEAVLIEKLVQLVAERKRVLLGFDFSLGFSTGFAAALANTAETAGLWNQSQLMVAQGLKERSSTIDQRGGAHNLVNAGSLSRRHTVSSIDVEPKKRGRTSCTGANVRKEGKDRKEISLKPKPALEDVAVPVETESLAGSLKREPEQGERTCFESTPGTDALIRDENIVVSKAHLINGVDQCTNRQVGWASVWRHLHTHVLDGEDNSNNRFEVAAQMNKMVGQIYFIIYLLCLVSTVMRWQLIFLHIVLHNSSTLWWLGGGYYVLPMFQVLGWM